MRRQAKRQQEWQLIGSRPENAAPVFLTARPSVASMSEGTARPTVANRLEFSIPMGFSTFGLHCEKVKASLDLKQACTPIKKPNSRYKRIK